MDDIISDEYEIDPIDEADRRARLECCGMQYWTIRRKIKMRPIGEYYYKLDEDDKTAHTALVNIDNGQ